uniref:Uncharacterized protein n=1 Tax=Glossina morsitans morsitans TaxID=37546 RepID=A0A1B0GDD6_GLOMM
MYDSPPHIHHESTYECQQQHHLSKYLSACFTDYYKPIFRVLKGGLSLSQTTGNYDIRYPTFVFHTNRVYNMLGPSIDEGPDLRPKERRCLQHEHFKEVIKTVVFRDAKDLKEETFAHLSYGRHSVRNYTKLWRFKQSMYKCLHLQVIKCRKKQQMQMAAAAQHQQHNIGPGGPAGAGPIVGAPCPCNIFLPKPSISLALSTTSNSSGGSAVMEPRHAPSPFGPTLPEIHHAPQTKFSSASISPLLERQRQSTPGNVTLRSCLTNLNLDFGYSKRTQFFSPSRLFPDDLTDPVGKSLSSSASKKSSTLADTSSTITVTKSNTPSKILPSITCTSTTSSTTSNKSSSNSVKLEPITTSSE